MRLFFDIGINPGDHKGAVLGTQDCLSFLRTSYISLENRESDPTLCFWVIAWHEENCITSWRLSFQVCKMNNSYSCSILSPGKRAVVIDKDEDQLFSV